VSRLRHGSDARSNILALSDAGRALYGQIAPKALEMEAALLSGLSDLEVEALKVTLQKLKDASHALR
jgi:DNA-binding MarR family transcriptional regulator